MKISAIMSEPHSWDEAYRGDRPLRRTSLFWACLPAFLLAFMMTVGIAVRVFLQAPTKASVLVTALAVLEVVILYIGWRFLRFIDAVRELLSSAPNQSEDILGLARWTARLFIFGMTGIGMAMMVSLMLLSR